MSGEDGPVHFTRGGWWHNPARSAWELIDWRGQMCAYIADVALDFPTIGAAVSAARIVKRRLGCYPPLFDPWVECYEALELRRQVTTRMPARPYATDWPTYLRPRPAEPSS